MQTHQNKLPEYKITIDSINDAYEKLADQSSMKIDIGLSYEYVWLKHDTSKCRSPSRALRRLKKNPLPIIHPSVVSVDNFYIDPINNTRIFDRV